MRIEICHARFRTLPVVALLAATIFGASPSHAQWFKVPNIAVPPMTRPGIGGPAMGGFPRTHFPSVQVPSQFGRPQGMPFLHPQLGVRPQMSRPLSMGSGWYQQGYRMSPPQISIHDVEREGGQAVGVVGQVGQTLFQGFVGGGMNGQGGGRYDADEDGSQRPEESEGEMASPPEEVTGSFLNPGQIRLPRITPPRVRLPW